MSKILVPEDNQPATLGRDIKLQYERDSGAIESIINGAMAGVAVRLLLAATLACLMVGAVAGTFYHAVSFALQVSR